MIENDDILYNTNFTNITNSYLIVDISGIRNVVKPSGLITFIRHCVSHLLEIGTT